jgi:hypothetical protein
MSDSYTEVTEQGLFSQITNSIKMVGFGLLLFVVAFPVLFLNEGRYVHRKQALDEGKGSVVSISPDVVDSSNEGKLVHLTGQATTEEILRDPVFAVEEQAIKLGRIAEMYQWIEKKESRTRKEVGGKKVTTTNYTYDRAWKEKPVSSSEFKRPEGHQNPASMPYQSQTWTAGEVTVGAFTLPSSLVGSIDDWTRIPATEELLNRLPEDVRDESVISAGGIYMGDDPAEPVIGDVRISFRAVKPTTVSLYARQVNDTFEQYTTEAGGALQRLEVGAHSPDEMFAAAQKENVVLLWVLRIVGFLMMGIGISLMFSPLVAVANILPFLGDVIQFGAWLFGLVVAFALSLITISIAWFFYRPIVAIPLFLVGAGAFVAFVVVTKKKGRGGETPVDTGEPAGVVPPEQEAPPGSMPEEEAPAEAEESLCPGCGAPVSTDDTFCGQCGKDLRTE